jgi:integrase
MRRIAAGSIFRKKYKDRAGRSRQSETWFLKFYLNGKPVESSTGTRDYDEALRMLREKIAAASPKSYTYTEDVNNVLVNQLLDLVVEDYRENKRATTNDTEKRIDKHLRPFFGQKRARDVGTKLLKEYRRRRDGSGDAEATINKELTWLRRAFKLGARHEPKLVLNVPYFPIIDPDNVREGVLPHEKYREVRNSLPPYARLSFVISYHTGARKGEIRKIRVEMIDWNTSRIELQRKTTKNKTARYLPIYGDMRAEIEMALSAADPACPFLIQHEGKQVFDFEKSWKTACKAAGIPQALYHDLRRTALTNMIEAGFSEKEAMSVSGHKTRSVFDRYHIVSSRRLKELGKKMEAHLITLDTTVLDNGARQNQEVREGVESNGEPAGTRTRDHRIKSAMLYQLSYRPGTDFTIAWSYIRAPIGALR